MDFDRLKFTPEYHGSIDNGAEWNYYAPNTLQKEDDRRILFGWIPGFKENQGWQGAISLPRDLSIDAEGRLIQKPVPELTAIRGELVSETDVALRNSSKEVEVHYPQFELMVYLAGGGTNHIGFRFNDEDGTPYEIALEPETIRFGDETVAIDPPLDDQIQMVHLFFDRTIIEIFVNDGLLCATKVIYPDRDNLNFEIFSQDGEIVLESIDTWEMISIW
jgi:beta-fructofuranosidase